MKLPFGVTSNHDITDTTMFLFDWRVFLCNHPSTRACPPGKNSFAWKVLPVMPLRPTTPTSRVAARQVRWSGWKGFDYLANSAQKLYQSITHTTVSLYIISCHYQHVQLHSSGGVNKATLTLDVHDSFLQNESLNKL